MAGPFIGGLPRSPGGAQGPPAALPRPWAGPSGGRPAHGRQALSPVGGRQVFFFRDLIANLKKKIYT